MAAQIGQTTLDSRDFTDWKRLVRQSWVVIGVVFGLGGIWAATARLDSGAVAPGVVAAESSRKTVQHLEGGIVKEIRARDGDLVEKGQLIVRLDDTQSIAAKRVLEKQLAAALVEEARLLAERDGAETVSFPAEVVREREDPLIARAIADQTAQFRERRSNVQAQQAILEARVSQMLEGMKGTIREREADEEQIATIQRELVGLRSLLEKNLVQLPRVLSLEREQSRLRGAVGRAQADLARSEQSIGETRMQIAQLRQQFIENVSKDLPAIRKTIAELREKLAVQSDILRRVDIVAPQTGVIQGSKVFTIGGVIRPGEQIMDVVPITDELVVRAQVSPNDVDTVHLGDTAEIRFPAFSINKPPLFFGKVKRLSRDRVTDDKNPNAQPFFAAEIAVDYANIEPYYRDRIMAGMAADVIIATGERTAIQYILGPLIERLRVGMRER
jgi:HlyD family secretion protein